MPVIARCSNRHAIDDAQALAPRNFTQLVADFTLLVGCLLAGRLRSDWSPPGMPAMCTLMPVSL